MPLQKQRFGAWPEPYRQNCSKKTSESNSLAPGPIDTPIFEKVGVPAESVPDMKESFAGQNPMKRMGSPDEIAKAALFLASDDSSYITGIDLPVDGGMTQL